MIPDFVAKSPKLCKIRICGAIFNYSLINVHALTEDKEEDEKEAFYEELDDLHNSFPKNDIKIIFGDFNSKIGKEHEFRPTIGSHSLHDDSNDTDKGLSVLQPNTIWFYPARSSHTRKYIK